MHITIVWILARSINGCLCNIVWMWCYAILANHKLPLNWEFTSEFFHIVRLTLSIDCDSCPPGQATNGSVNRKGVENIWLQHLDQYKKVCDIRPWKRITTVSMVISGLFDGENVKMLFSVDLAIDANIMCWEEQIFLLNFWVVSYLSVLIVLILFSEFVYIFYNSRVLWTSTSAVYSTGWWDTTFQQHVVHFLNLILLLVIIIPKSPPCQRLHY